MGRRKIEIKAIKDDRNRSVTFLKRKGGLFKKAHELSVLCSVDVAVIIFGNNKKLYEYSSSDIGEILTRYQYYGGANEHKGPADFTGKGKDMDDDDDDDGSGMSHNGSVEPQMLPPQFQSQPAFQHMRHSTASASPPIPNGVFPHHQQRQHTPQPQAGPGSRPSSRNAPRRQSSNLVPQGPHHPPPAQNGYAYMPNPAIYNPQTGPSMPSHQHGIPQHMQAPPMQAPPMQGPPQPQGPQYPNFTPQQQHLQQMYAEDQRRTSMPPAFPQQERPASRTEASPPQPQQQQIPLPSKQEPEQQHSAPQGMLEPVKRMSVKSRSIFTPIDESRSILSQHWASSTSNAEPPRGDTATSNNRSQSVDVGTGSRTAAQTPPSPPQRLQTHNKNRNTSMSSLPDGFTPPSRTNSAQLSGGGGRRPLLKVQIPDEPSDGGSNTADSNSPPSSNAATRKNGQGNEHGTAVVLPPPSPSASALLSAGATGPSNPFARPHPVSQSSNDRSNNMIDTPVSALPSRFMNNDFLPSPSSFYPDWGFNGREGNTLPSPLNFATPIVGSGPSFMNEDSNERASERQGSQGGQSGITKRKTPDSEEGGDSKRAKHEG